MLMGMRHVQIRFEGVLPHLCPLPLGEDIYCRILEGSDRSFGFPVLGCQGYGRSGLLIIGRLG